MNTITVPDGMYSHTYYGLTDYELKLIFPAIKRQLKHAEKMAEYYADIVDSGCATERQSSAMFNWQDKVEKLGRIINDAESIIKKLKRT